MLGDMLVKFFFLGMLVWLGFVIVIDVELDILILDEVLFVGDESFKYKF